MEIESIKIENYKSLVNFELKLPNSFSVFVGANASGKSNIFEALELLYFFSFMNPKQALNLFGSANDLFNKNNIGGRNKQGATNRIMIHVPLWDNGIGPYVSIQVKNDSDKNYYLEVDEPSKEFESTIKPGVGSAKYNLFFNFTRLFVNNKKLVKRIVQDDSKLALDALNLEKVLKRLLKNKNKKEEIIDWLQLLIPEFEKIEIVSDDLNGSDNLLIYEKGTNKPFNKNLISDGTYNILAILTAVYQSDEPQFLCIEEPENGLNPKVIKELVNLFRQKCKEGHFIWLNTHSQTLVSELTTDEIILVDKINGETIVKQVKGMNLHGLKMDEALLTNALGGGIPW